LSGIDSTSYKEDLDNMQSGAETRASATASEQVCRKPDSSLFFYEAQSQTPRRIQKEMKELQFLQCS